MRVWLAVAACLVVGFVAGRSTAPPPAAQVDAGTYTCSMHPHVRRQEPGICPACGMALVAVAPSSEPKSPRQIQIGYEAAMRGRIRTARAERRPLTPAGHVMYGTVEYRSNTHAIAGAGSMDSARCIVSLTALASDEPLLATHKKLVLEVQPNGMRVSADVSGTRAAAGPGLIQLEGRCEKAHERIPSGTLVRAWLMTDGSAAQDSRPYVPATAPLFTGTRALLYVQATNARVPTYEARPVRLGEKLGDTYPVEAGLEHGELVVVEGAFVVDAELQLRGGVSMMAVPGDAMSNGLEQLLHPSPELQQSLAKVIDAYFALGAALAADDFAKTKQAAAGLAALARTHVLAAGTGSVVMPRLTAAEESKLTGQKLGAAVTRHAVADTWIPLLLGLATEAAQLGNAPGIGEARDAFTALSETTLALLSAFGNPRTEALQVVSCPMANEGRGARWAQAGPDVANPYYGSKMLRCGTIRATLRTGAHLLGED